jgi:N-acetylglucosaminyldiphosphoundecaprenol N-acetyl-beta-D-mannosaminyltransferase
MARLLGYHILKSPLDTVDFDTVKVINTINPHSYCVSKTDPVFAEALQCSDILLPDGVGIVWAEKVLNGNRITKIAGYDLFQFLMLKANTEHSTVFFLGASQATLDKIKENAKMDYPNVKVHSYSPP